MILMWSWLLINAYCYCLPLPQWQLHMLYSSIYITANTYIYIDMHTQHIFRQRRWSSRRCWWCFAMIWSTILLQLARSASQLSPKSRQTSRPTHWRCSLRRKWTWYVCTDLRTVIMIKVFYQMLTCLNICTHMYVHLLLVCKVVCTVHVHPNIRVHVNEYSRPGLKPSNYYSVANFDPMFVCWASIHGEAYSHFVRYYIRYYTFLLSFC